MKDLRDFRICAISRISAINFFCIAINIKQNAK